MLEQTADERSFLFFPLPSSSFPSLAEFAKRRILNFSVGTGSAGRRGRVEAERAVATLAHRRGRAGAGAL